MHNLTFTTPRTARYLLLGEPGPAIEQVWVCLHGHGQSLAELADSLHLVNASTRLLLLPEGLSRFEVPTDDAALPRTGAAWFASDSLLADLADLGAYLDALTQEVLAACSPGMPLTVFGHGHGAAAACRWLAGNGTGYTQLILHDAVFPAQIDRRATLVALPERPVLVVTTTTPDAIEATEAGLLQDLLDVGLSARHYRADAGPLPLAVLAPAATQGSQT